MTHITSAPRTVTLLAGDGIGPEVARAVCRIVEAAGAPIVWEPMLAGAEVFKKGDPSGVPRDTIDSIMRTRVALKGPLETPVGYGEKSANVTLRKLFELYANVRPTREMPGVPGVFAGRHIDLVVVRENVEDLYAGVEHMQSPGLAQCLKLISRKGCEKIIRLAFEIARAEGRKKVHCATKANIMKLTEGLIKRTFEDVAPEYPDIAAEHIIVDNCAHQLVRAPEQFDVLVMTNMNGDIISDLTSGLTGGLGLAPSANLGNEAVIFEAVHGSAPSIAGKDIANPTALLLSAVMMLRHMGFHDHAQSIENALIVTLEEGRTLTVDLSAGTGNPPATTTQFTDAVIANLGKRSEKWQARAHKPLKMPEVTRRPDMVQVGSRRYTGVDVFVESALPPRELGQSLERLAEGTPFRLSMVSNRGVMVYPAITELMDTIDVSRCRFMLKDGGDMNDSQLIGLLQRVGAQHRWMHLEKLLELDGKAAYSKSQGEN